MKSTIIVITVIVMFLAGQWAGGLLLDSFRRSDVTWYDLGTMTASGEPFAASGMTMAVKSYGAMGYWYKVSYRGHSVYVWANDILPASAKADYDLSEGAFARLADLRQGHIRARVERLHD